MNTTNKSLNEVFQTLRDLVKSPGYIYVLLFMIEEDICIPFSQLKEADPQIRLSMKEAAMLVGLYINENNDVLKEPNNIDSLFDLRAKTYQVLDDLHWAMNEPLAKEMREAVNRYMSDSKQQFSPNQILAHATHMRETFFYSNEPAYDLEYLFFAPSKYKYDEEWLHRNKGFDISEAANIAIVIKKLFDGKRCIISSLSKEQINEMISNDRRLKKDKTSAERTRKFLTLQKFEDLLSTEVDDDHDYFECIDCHKLCQILLDLFMIEKSVIEKLNGIKPFLDNFSTEIYPSINSDFTEPGKSNVVTWKPKLKVVEDQYILPLPYLLFQSIYETPYYWLMEDKHYAKTAGSHLGDADGLNEGIIYGNQTTSRSFLAHGKNVGRAIPFLFRPVINTKTIIIDCHANHQPECRPLGNVILRHFSCALSVSSDKRFGAGSRGVPKPIQPMSLLNLGLWRLLAGFFPKAGIRLPLLRNFRNMHKRL